MWRVFKNNINIMRGHFRIMEVSKFWTVLIFICSFFGHGLGLVVPLLSANIITYVTSGQITDSYLNVILLAITYVALNGVWGLWYISYSHCFLYSYRKLRERIVNKVLTYDSEHCNKISNSEILNTVNVDTSNLGEMINDISELPALFVKVIVTIGIFLFTDVYIGILALVVECLYMYWYNYCNERHAKYYAGQLKYRDQMTANLSQVLNGLDEVQTFNIGRKIKRDFNQIAEKWSAQYAAKRRYVNIRTSVLPFITRTGEIVMYIVIIAGIFAGRYEIDTLVMLLSYWASLLKKTDEMMSYSFTLHERSMSIGRIDRLLNYQPEQLIAFGSDSTDNIRGAVQFKNVDFAYKHRNMGSIHNIRFTAEPHQITALVGHSGSGKTTITNLLLRRYMPDDGTITLDGKDIFDFTNEVYATNVVGVNQIPFIFNMSIKRNLSLIDSNIEHQIEACKRVGIHDYIASLPRGYNTVLTEDATNFSGGQRQLLAIARTLLSKAEVIIFDEVTSALDPILVEKIKNVFMDLRRDHTIVVVTHKPDVMQIADKIIVLNHGRIIAQGKHAELMQTCPYYQSLQTASASSMVSRVTQPSLLPSTAETEKY